VRGRRRRLLVDEVSVHGQAVAAAAQLGRAGGAGAVAVGLGSAQARGIGTAQGVAAVALTPILRAEHVILRAEGGTGLERHRVGRGARSTQAPDTVDVVLVAANVLPLAVDSVWLVGVQRRG